MSDESAAAAAAPHTVHLMHGKNKYVAGGVSTVDEVSDWVATVLNVPKDGQKLLCKGTLLKDGAALVASGSKIMVMGTASECAERVGAVLEAAQADYSKLAAAAQKRGSLASADVRRCVAAVSMLSQMALSPTDPACERRSSLVEKLRGLASTARVSVETAPIIDPNSHTCFKYVPSEHS